LHWQTSNLRSDNGHLRLWIKIELRQHMDLTNKTVIKDLLKKHGAKPEKYLGQHFILSKKALAQMVTAAEIKKNDTIVEIGPGLGTLTQELAKTGTKIIAIEKDPAMIAILKETLADYKNIKIIQADARQMIDSGNQSDWDKKYKIVANLPYSVATFLIRQWLDPPPSPRLRRARPELMVLMIQKEVAQRIAAKPPHMNLLAVSTQFLATAKVVDYVPAEAFWPQPKVDSAIIKIVPRVFNISGASFASDRKQMMQIVKAGFSQPRKQLIGNLAKKLNAPREKLIEIFKDLNISEQVRAENLSLEQWIKLSLKLHTI